jgi:hypothetical protein
VSREVLRSEPDRGFACRPPLSLSDGKLADLVAPIVIEADGTVVPLQYGFGRRYALGNIKEEPMSALSRRWQADGYERFLALCREAHDQYVTGPQSFQYFNWYEAITAMSQHD